MAVRYHREHMLDDPPNMVDSINYRVNVIYLHLWTAQKHSEHISGRTRPPHQCVTVPKMLNDTDTNTFSGTKYFRYRYQYFFRYQIFPIPVPRLFRYQIFPIPVSIPPKKWKIPGTCTSHSALQCIGQIKQFARHRFIFNNERELSVPSHCIVLTTIGGSWLQI